MFKERPRSCSHNPSLSRSPAVKRRNDHSIKIAGLATLGTRKFANRLSSSSTSLRGSKSISGDVAGGVGSVVVDSSGQKQGKKSSSIN